MNTFTSKFAIIPQKKQVVKIRKIKAGSDSDYDERLAQDCKNFNSNCSLHVNHP